MHTAGAIFSISLCFAAGLTAGWLAGKPDAASAAGKIPGIPAARTEISPGAASFTAELKAIRTLAAEVPPTLEGILAAADTPPALTAEAVIIEALRPLGLETWRVFFNALRNPHGDDDVTRYKIVRRALLRLWAAAAPAEAMTALLDARPGEFVYPDEAAIVARHLLAEGFDHAVSLLRGKKGGSAHGALGEVAFWCVDHAPDKISEVLECMSATGISAPPSLSSVLEKWATRDSVGAQRWAESQKPWSDRYAAMKAVCEGLAKKSPPEAQSWIQTLPEGAMRSHMQDALVSYAAYEGAPESAAKTLSTINPSRADVHNGALVSVLVERWALTDQKAALVWALAQPNPNRSFALESFAEAVSQTTKSWEEVEALAASMPDEESRAAALTHGIANLPPAEASAHLDKVTGEARFRVLNQAINGDPPLPLDEALALAQEYAGMEDADLRRLAPRLLDTRGPEAALAWIDSLPEEIREETKRAFISNWATNDPEGALNSAAATADSELHRLITQEAFSAWMMEDPPAVSEWLADQPPGTIRDEGASRLAEGLARTNSAAALPWAASIGDEQIRRGALERLRVLSRGRHTESWRAVVEASALSSTEKSRLLAPP